MKPDVTEVNSSAQRHTERLNRAIKVHVIEGVLVVPDASSGVGHFVTHKPNTVVAGIGFNLVHCCAYTCPDLDSGLHSHRGADR